MLVSPDMASLAGLPHAQGVALLGWWPTEAPSTMRGMLSAVERWAGLAVADPRRPSPTTHDGLVAALLVSSSGLICGTLRTHAGWTALDRLHLPGAGMTTVELSPATAPATATDDVQRDEARATARYSRLAGALGPDALQRIQRSVFTIVGAGRTGSAVAHSLVRYGSSVVLIDPDKVEPHNLDGDALLPMHEGLYKVDALARALKPLLRPGAFIDARMLDVASDIAGALVACSDVVVSAVDNDRARLHGSLWSCAHLKPLVDIGLAVLGNGVDQELGADVRLVPAGGCLHCTGGFARPDLLGSPQAGLQGEFGRVRAGSLRSLGQIGAHLGLRLLEQLYAGESTDDGPGRFIQLRERARGRIEFADQSLPRPLHCDACAGISGTGADDIERLDAGASRRFDRVARRLADGL